MEIILYLLSAFALTFALKESDGPWNIISWLRNYLMQNQYVGVFFYKLFSCYLCLGCWSGALIYLISQENYKIGLFVCWSLAAGAFSLIMSIILDKLSKTNA